MAEDLQQAGPALSSRGRAQIDVGKGPLMIHKYMRDTYHPTENPDGIINIGVAENTLMHEELSLYFEKKFHLSSEDFTYGDGLTGSLRLCNALANLFNSQFNPRKPVVAEHLIVGAGLIPLMSQACRVIADPGDGILLAAPYYSGFDTSFRIQNNVSPVGVPIPESDMFTLAELTHLERGLQESNMNGITIKAVLLCNPHNPLGRCYPPEVILAYCHFCELHDLHLLSDEIYALSVFPSRDVPNPEPFISVLSLDLEAYDINPSRIHVLYGMSKDFNANGFRAGVFLSQSNASLIQALTVAGILMLLSTPTDSLWSSILMDESYLSDFIKNNRIKLTEAYEHLTSWLRSHSIPYIPSSAGHFLMVDMRPVLSNIDRYGSLLSISPEHSMGQRESALFTWLLEHKVIVTQGLACHAAESGWFRFTFSVRRDFMDTALKRIDTAMKWGN